MHSITLVQIIALHQLPEGLLAFSIYKKPVKSMLYGLITSYLFYKIAATIIQSKLLLVKRRKKRTFPWYSWCAYERCCRKYNPDDLDQTIIEEYVKLDPEMRNAIKILIKKILKSTGIKIPVLHFFSQKNSLHILEYSFQLLVVTYASQHLCDVLNIAFVTHLPSHMQKHPFETPNSIIHCFLKESNQKTNFRSCYVIP